MNPPDESVEDRLCDIEKRARDGAWLVEMVRKYRNMAIEVMAQNLAAEQENVARETVDWVFDLTVGQRDEYRARAKEQLEADE